MDGEPKEKQTTGAEKPDRPFWGQGPGTPALPGGRCRTPPHQDWSEPEIWAWEKICAGEIADFNEETDCEYCPLPWAAEGWERREGENRKLSSRFLETILLYEPWRSAVPRRGVIIRGAWFVDPVDVATCKIDFFLALDYCRFETALELREFKSPNSFSLTGSAVSLSLGMERAEIGSALFMTGGRFGLARLRGARIKDQLSMKNARCSTRLDLDNTEIGGSLVMQGGLFGEVRPLGARIGGNFEMDEVQIYGELVLEYTAVGGAFFMRNGQVGQARMVGAKIGGQLSMVGSQFLGEVTMQGNLIGEALLLGFVKTESRNHINKSKNYFNVHFCEVGTILDIRGAKFGSELDLTGTKVDSLLCGRGDVPPQLKLDRFTYNHLGGIGWKTGEQKDDQKEDQKGERMTDWPASWFVDWLARQKDYSPQPYEQCAKVLREEGQPGKANDVLYAGKERERENAPWPQRIWLNILKYTIGYGLGFKNLRVLAWAVPLVMIGAGYFAQTKAGAPFSWPERYAYSFDMLLPVIELTKSHGDVLITGWQKYYFYFHKLMGWLLSFFLIAGLTGITERKS